MLWLPDITLGQSKRNRSGRSRQERQSRRSAVEALQTETAKLKALLDKDLQRELSPQSFQQLSPEQRNRLREEWFRERARQQQIVETPFYQGVYYWFGEHKTEGPGGHNEAPALLKSKGKYYLLTSGCTGWAPNAARLAVADSIWGPWHSLDNPCVGLNPQNVLGPEKTFGGQSTFILPVRGKRDAFIAMFDMWRPRNAIDGRYLWLPIQFTDEGIRIEWANEWELSTFEDQPEESNEQGIVTDASHEGYSLVWADEFNKDGPPDPCNWTYEQGFVRNQELQWYQPDNARCENGLLIIEGRRQRVPNPNYTPGSRDWRRKDEYAEYTSACLKTKGRHQWTYGRFEMRARIDTRPGLWPAFWTLGSARGWPGCGEIDIMEYYRGMLLANACWAGEGRWRSVWDDLKKPITDFDDEWSSRFHVWRMDWDENSIKLYVDDELLNTVDLSTTINGTPDKANPFHEPHSILLNLAIGGTNGGDPSQTKFPARFEIDYVRVYEK